MPLAHRTFVLAGVSAVPMAASRASGNGIAVGGSGTAGSVLVDMQAIVTRAGDVTFRWNTAPAGDMDTVTVPIASPTPSPVTLFIVAVGSAANAADHESRKAAEAIAVRRVIVRMAVPPDVSSGMTRTIAAQVANSPEQMRGTRMTGITQANFTFRDFRTTGGEILPEVTLAYVTRGTLAADGRNAILITHGYTSGPRMIEPGVASSEGAWSTLVGPGAPIDTDRYFVVCSNVLGSSYGSTNAASLDPRTGRPYGSRFPCITVEDIVNAQMRMLEGIGVKHLRAVVGPSYGGFQAFQWGVTFPDFMDGIVPVVTSPRPPNSDRVAGLLKWFEPDPNWNGGDYYETGGVKQTLTALRVDTLTRYGLANSLAARFPTKEAADAELHRIAAQWAEVFDANSCSFSAGRWRPTTLPRGSIGSRFRCCMCCRAPMRCFRPRWRLVSWRG